MLIKDRIFILLCAFVIAIGPISIDMYLPAMPALQLALKANVGQVQATMAVYFIGLAAGQLLFGPASDLFGRKPVLRIGLAIYVIAAVGCTMAPSIQTLTLARFLQALGGCSGAVVIRAMVRDRFETHEVSGALSTITLVMGSAPMIAPFLGGLINAVLGWRAVFGFLAVYGAIALCVLQWGLPETHVKRTQMFTIRSLWSGYWGVLRNGPFMGYALGGGFAQAGFYVYMSSAAFAFTRLYLVDSNAIGPLFAANTGCYIAGSQLNRLLVRKFGCETVFHVGLVTYLVVTSLLAVVMMAKAGSLLFTMALIGASLATIGVVFPNSIALGLALQPQKAGTAAAVIGALQYGVAGLASMVLGFVGTTDGASFGVGMACCALIAICTSRVLGRTRNAYQE